MADRMKVFFDTEFIDTGFEIDLISIGLIREDEETLYLVSSEYNHHTKDQWVRDNVLIHIPTTADKYPRDHIAEMIKNFLADVEKPEFWAYYADYDWVALCQLYGRMLDIPSNWPKYCRDLKQLADDLNLRLPPKPAVEHHALADARWVKDSFDFCISQRKVVV